MALYFSNYQQHTTTVCRAVAKTQLFNTEGWIKFPSLRVIVAIILHFPPQKLSLRAENVGIMFELYKPKLFDSPLTIT